MRTTTDVVVIDAVVVLEEHCELRGLAGKINDAVDAAEAGAKSAVEQALAAGALLTEAKLCVQHGGWEIWLQRSWKPRRFAQRCSATQTPPAASAWPRRWPMSWAMLLCHA